MMARSRCARLCLYLASLLCHLFLCPTKDEAKLRAADHATSDALTQAIDREIAAAWERSATRPAVPASDAEFLRRAYVDLAGKIPPVSVVRRFLDDSNVDKRRELVDKLLEQPAHATQMSRVFVARLAPEATQDQQKQHFASTLETWLLQQFRAQKPYNEIVAGLIGEPVPQEVARNSGTGPQAWIALNDSLPENLAASTARVFMGLKIECAQCHNHPFDHWTREEFWSLAAFFGGVEGTGAGGTVGAPDKQRDRRKLGIPGTDQIVPARFLTGEEPDWKPEIGARQMLADWLAKPDNPYVARAIVNRVWAQFFGIGLVDPVDDFGERNPPSHPALLDELVRGLLSERYDLRVLTRSIVLSRPYQLSSELADASQSDPRRFARFTPRAMSATQMFESLREARGVQIPLQRRRGPAPAPPPDAEALLALPAESTGAYEYSIPQALYLMNGPLTDGAAGVDKGLLFSAVVDSPFLTDPERVETFFLATVSRRPTAAEAERLLARVEGAKTEVSPKSRADGARSALADIYWMLLNSSEFMLNH